MKECYFTESSENLTASKKTFYRFWQEMREHRLGQKALRETVTGLLTIVTMLKVEKSSKIAYFLKTTMKYWWAGPDLNRRPSARQADVLTELDYRPSGLVYFLFRYIATSSLSL